MIRCGAVAVVLYQGGRREKQSVPRIEFFFTSRSTERSNFPPPFEPVPRRKRPGHAPETPNPAQPYSTSFLTHTFALCLTCSTDFTNQSIKRSSRKSQQKAGHRRTTLTLPPSRPRSSPHTLTAFSIGFVSIKFINILPVLRFFGLPCARAHACMSVPSSPRLERGGFFHASPLCHANPGQGGGGIGGGFCPFLPVCLLFIVLYCGF